MIKILTHMVYLLCPALLLLMSGCESEVFLSGQPEEGNSSDGKVRVEIFARANTWRMRIRSAWLPGFSFSKAMMRMRLL